MCVCVGVKRGVKSLYHPELEHTPTDSQSQDRENASGQDALFVCACVGVCLKAAEREEGGSEGDRTKNCVCVCVPEFMCACFPSVCCEVLLEVSRG